MSIEARWASHTDAVRNHWFSRRHPSADEHRAQQAMDRVDRETRQFHCNSVQEAWRKLTPTQQIADLDNRLGVGVGAKRQRAKLTEVK